MLIRRHSSAFFRQRYALAVLEFLVVHVLVVSLVVVALAFTAVYDVIIALSQFKTVPPMFNFLAALTITLSLLVDIIALVCEMRSFSVYFSDDVQ